MAHLFRELSLGNSRRNSPSPTLSKSASSLTSVIPPSADPLPSPLGRIDSLSDPDLRMTAFEIFVAACRTSSSKPLSNANANAAAGLGFGSGSESSPRQQQAHTGTVLQKSLTSAAASKMKKALGLKSPRKGGGGGSPGSAGSGNGRGGKMTVGELMRLQMRVPENEDSRVRRALLRISAGQVKSVDFLLAWCAEFRRKDYF